MFLLALLLVGFGLMFLLALLLVQVEVDSSREATSALAERIVAAQTAEAAIHTQARQVLRDEVTQHKDEVSIQQREISKLARDNQLAIVQQHADIGYIRQTVTRIEQSLEKVAARTNNDRKPGL